MTEAAILEAPKTPARLVRPRDEAVAHLQAQLQRGAEIKALRIRSGSELDQARAAKLDWTNRTTQLLNELFDSPTLAEECNDWVGRIYPEYAEFGNFVEQFYAEMDHRLKRLKSVLKQVEKALPLPRTGPAAPAVAAPIPRAPTPAPAPPKMQILCGMVVVCKADDPSRQAVTDFLESLEINLSVVDGTAGIADSLDRAGDVSFAVVLSAETQAEYGFELGFCAGRLGLKRVILVHTQPVQEQSDTRGFTHVGMDPGGGWQLQLARQLKRAGLGIDLNRLC